MGGTTVSQTVATDAYGQADGVLLNGEEIVSYTFDDFGRLTSRQLNTDTPYNATMTFYPVSTEASTSYRVHTLNNGRETYSYGYDGNGNITSIGSGIVLRSYEYDSLGQMTVEHDRYTNSTTLYTYDQGGNLLQKAVYPDFYGANGTPTITNYTYGNSVWADQLTNYNGTAITYDNSGNPLNWRNGLSFTWQNGRQLASAANASNEVTYTYNQNGIRTSKTVNGVKTTYILDENDQLMGEITGNNTTVFLYDENDVVYGFLYNNTPYFYLFNGQGDVVNVVDETGAVVATYNYDAWGNVISSTGTMATINPIRYRGYYYDAETELYYLQSRYYDAQVARFLNADDPIYLGLTGTSLGYNLFAYCENNPINKIDPDGNIAANIIGAAIGAIIGVIGGAFLGNWLADVLKLKGLTRWIFIVGVAALVGATVGAIGYFIGPYVAKIATKLGQYVANLINQGKIAFQNLSSNVRTSIKSLLKQTCCFVAGTKVLTENGHVSIEDICPGDLVSSRHSLASHHCESVLIQPAADDIHALRDDIRLAAVICHRFRDG